ncbi:ABC transporter ATP-binding protein [Proteinivorax hydrogeniformans]|uniref:ABC transporter ATP-binding protein n=1 Tax=Proteinivorax hydrogeniformans TaxID=1826727 RepID=A0AAU8HT31_9FIRM
MIKINGVSKAFVVNKKKVIGNDNINLEVPPNSVFALLGPNGAGKTTLIKIICNLIRPNSGDVLINGSSIFKNTNIAKEEIGVVLESARNVYQYLSVEETLKYFGYLNNQSKKELASIIDDLLSSFDLVEKREAKVGTLSRGMQQKVAIMLAMLKDPQILILDEPTLGLDVENRIKIKKLILDLSKEKTVILTTHDLAIAEEVADNIAIIDNGKIVKSTTMQQLKGSYSEKVEMYMMLLKLNSLQVKVLENFEGIRKVKDLGDNVWEIVGDRKVLQFALQQESIIELKKVSPDLKDIFIDIIS